MNLTLDENHVYRLDDRPIDGLTATIKEAGLIRGGDPWYMDRGTAIHKATEFYDKGTLDEESLDPQITGYLESWKRFRKDMDYTPTGIEIQTFHPILQIATTIDRIPGPIDLKSGGSEPWHILQVALQWHCLEPHDHTFPADIYLDPDGGPPKVRKYTYQEMREAFKIYSSMLVFIRWRREKYGSSNK